MLTTKITQFIFSSRLMALLFIAFALSMGIGTFLENDYGTTAARIWIYNAWWFELIMFLFLVNFSGNIVRYKLHEKDKWPTLLLHLAFIFILVGAVITRYISYEGVMPIREGETTNKFLSEKTYLTTLIDGDLNGEMMRKTLQKELEIAAPTNNNFTINTDFNGQPVQIKYVNFIKGAELGLIPSDNGDLYLKLVEAGEGKRHDHYLKEGEVTSIHNILYALNKPTPGAINITYTDKDEYFIESPFKGSYMRMADQFRGQVAKDSLQPLQLRSLYQMAGTQFVIPEPTVKGKYDVIEIPIKEKGQQNALILNVTTKGETKQVKLLGGKGFVNNFKQIKIGGLDVALRYGSKELTLPFALKLNDFIAKKYPGTETGYASFKSKVELVENEKSKPYEIFMNHVLDHKGYRFFQASFDPDEKGTILSVNHDFWGSWITYIGYFLLYIGLMGILFIKGSRFKHLEDKLNKIKLKKAALSLALICTGVYFTSAEAQTTLPSETHTTPTKRQLDSIIKSNIVPKAHAEKFGSLVIQDKGGRMKPLNTFSSELLRKLSKRDNYEGLNADQVFLSMLQNPFVWYNVPLIYIKKENDSIRKIIGTPKGEKRVALVDLFDKNGIYKLEPYLQAATSTNTPNNFEKDFLETHKKVSLLNEALAGSALRIFPIPNDKNNKWVAPPELNETKLSGMDSVYTRQILPIYRSALIKSKTSGNYKKPETYLESIKSFQKKFGSEVIPSDKKIQTEIKYNKYDVFRKLFVYYMLGGLFLLIFVIVQIFSNNKPIRILITIGKVLIVGLFIIHTVGLIARWYVSGHAPWSDAYESMIYVAWATQFFGIALGRKSDLTIGATAFVTSIILMVAHWNWMDPEIANLQPVLNSYWLMIHVAVIVASYGPFILGAILGALALILMLMTTKQNKKKMKLHIDELTVVNEMALTIGLVMLTIGNFLGGQWANESWGRYWGWDPKETWALISIMVYAFVIHMRLVPGLRGKWTYNFMSLIAVATIMMTYFGVNFYLSGLHSYASGDQVITPNFIWYSVAIAFALGGFSYWRYKIHYKK